MRRDTSGTLSPSCSERLTTSQTAAASFFGFSPILLPYRQPLEAVLGLLRKTSPDVLIAGAGTIPLTEVAHSCPQLKHVIWVVQQGSRHLDWNEVPEGFGGKVGVSVWHELIEEKKSSIEGDLPYDVDRPGDSFRLVTMWQKEDDEVGDVVEYTEAVSILRKRKTCLRFLTRLEPRRWSIRVHLVATAEAEHHSVGSLATS